MIKIETRRLGQLLADPANPRTHDERNISAIMASLREHGQVEPLLVQASTGMVIAGNGRREAMARLGWTEATCSVVDVDDTQARKLSIALNRSGELAGWDEAVLTKHLQALGELEDYDLGDLGFDESELQQLVAAYGENMTELSTPAPDGPGPGDGEVTAPTPLPTSSVKQVQLYLDENTLPQFKRAVKQLGLAWALDNQSDVVLRAVLSAAQEQG